MAKEVKPIKRSKELAPLSKDHHEGLLFGWKIKQGLRYGAGLAVMANYAQWFWEADLAEHFRKEEDVLAPYLPTENEWVKRMFDEHKAIKALVDAVASSNDETVLVQLAGKIHDHIRFEERVLFPYAEEVIAPDDLRVINEGLLVASSHTTKWENEFWVKK